MKLKDIRFNLRFSRGKDKDGQEQFDIIRSLQDLKDNLNIDDLYLYFTSGQLARWLTCIGEPDKGEAIVKIDRESPIKDQLKRIFDTLCIELSPNDLDSMIESYTYFKELEQKKWDTVALLRADERINEQDYIQYGRCLRDIISVSEDFNAVKARVRAMLRIHPHQFKLDWMRFYDVMILCCPLAIFVVLMDSDYRDYYLGDKYLIATKYFSPFKNLKDDEMEIQIPVLQRFMDRVSNLLAVAYHPQLYKLKLTLDRDKVFYEDTYLLRDRQIIKEIDYSKSGGEWEDAVDKNTKVMILHCGNNITVRPAGDKEHPSKGNQCGRFPIFDGLDFRTSVNKPNSAEDILLYMEVK